MFKWARNLWKSYREAETLHGIWGWGVTQGIFALFTSGVTVVTGLLGSIPLMYVWVATVGVAAMTFHGLARYREWHLSRTISGKVYVNRVVMGFEAQVANDNQLYLASLTVGIEIANKSTQIIHYSMKSFKSVFSNRISSPPQVVNTGGRIPPENTAVFRDSNIEFNDLVSIDTAYDAFLEYKVDFKSSGSNEISESGLVKIVIRFYIIDGEPHLYFEPYNVDQNKKFIRDAISGNLSPQDTTA